LDVVN